VTVKIPDCSTERLAYNHFEHGRTFKPKIIFQKASKMEVILQS